METLPHLTKREELIEFLNFKAYNLSNISIKDVIEEFKNSKNIQMPTSTAYRIVKRWNEEQMMIRDQSLSARVCDQLIEVFDS